MMATKSSIGDNRLRGVIATRPFRLARMNPVCSATPTPSRATKTTPRGAKPVKTVTMLARNAARLGPESWFWTTSVRAPSLAGTVNSWPASSNDAIQTATRATTKSAAGSGKRLPTRSTQ